MSRFFLCSYLGLCLVVLTGICVEAQWYRSRSGSNNNNNRYNQNNNNNNRNYRGKYSSYSSKSANEEHSSSEPEILEACPQDCKNVDCPPITQCTMGLVRDRCGCCDVCGLEQNQLCNMEGDLTKMQRGGNNLPANSWHGRCGVDLKCRVRTDVDVSTVGRESICYCVKDGLVCGSDGTTYTHCQMHAVKEGSNGTIIMVGQGPCKSEPHILMISEGMEARVGSKIALICEVQGYPMPTVTWYFNKPGRSSDTQLLPGDSDELSVSVRGGPQATRLTSHLQITNFQPKHEGTYRCTAENDLGMDSKQVSVVQRISGSSAGSYHNNENEWMSSGWDDL